MSKKDRARRNICFAFAGILLCLIATNPFIPLHAQGGKLPAAEARREALAASTSGILKETSDIRELSILWPVKSGAQTRTEIENMVVKNLNEESTPEDLKASEVALKKFGLVGADFQLRAFLIDLLTEQVAGYYDAKTREFFLADWIDLDGQRPVMVHELTHALQDQHFNLRRFDKWPKSESDSELAAHALIEGDATLSMSMYMVRNPLRALAFMRSLPTGGKGSEEIDRAPRVLRETLLFPYDQGLRWATQVYKRGGWSAVSKAFSDLPQSTEQIMQPEAYFARKAPIKVELPNIGSILGKGWRRIDYDVNGEWSYYLILDQYLKSEAESKKVVMAWAGDRYAVYQRTKPSEVVITQLSVWDTEEAAREFFNAYSRRTVLRYKDESITRRPSSDESQTWGTSEGLVRIERHGKWVLVAEGMENNVSLNRVMERLGQHLQ